MWRPRWARPTPRAEQAVEAPWVKDYGAIEGEGPTRWAARFDVTNWGLISAHEAGPRVGGAVVVFDTAGVSMLEGAQRSRRPVGHPCPSVVPLVGHRVTAVPRCRSVGT